MVLSAHPAPPPPFLYYAHLVHEPLSRLPCVALHASACYFAKQSILFFALCRGCCKRNPPKNTPYKTLNSFALFSHPTTSCCEHPMEGLATGLSSSGIPRNRGVASSATISPGRVDMAYTLPQHDELEQVCGDTSFSRLLACAFSLHSTRSTAAPHRTLCCCSCWCYCCCRKKAPVLVVTGFFGVYVRDVNSRQAFGSHPDKKAMRHQGADESLRQLYDHLTMQ